MTELICLPLVTISPASQNVDSHYRIAPPEKSPQADNLPVKIRPIFSLPVNCRPAETFLESGRSYNKTPAVVPQVIHYSTLQPVCKQKLLLSFPASLITENEHPGSN